MNDSPDSPEKAKEPKVIYDKSYQRIYVGQGKLSFKDKLIFWSMVAGGIAVGTLFFLFFLSLFIYVLLPITLILLAWNLLKKRWNN